MLEAFGVSDPGCVRTNNEDYYLLAPAIGLYVVADGKPEELSTFDGVAFVTAKFAPDGGRVACMKYGYDTRAGKLEASELVVMDPDGKNETKVLTVANDEQQTRLLGWLPTDKK